MKPKQLWVEDQKSSRLLSSSAINGTLLNGNSNYSNMYEYETTIDCKL